MKQKLLNISSFSHIQKAYQEGIYADTPANKKLGRVGMTYTAYNDYIQRKKEGEDVDLENHKKNDSLEKNKTLLENSLKNIETFHSKSIPLSNGNKIMVNESKNKYSAIIVDKNYDIIDTLESPKKENFISNLNTYLYENDWNVIDNKPSIPKEEKMKENSLLTKEDITLDNKNKIDIFRPQNNFSAESGFDIPILNKNKEIIGYIQKRQVGLDEGAWSWDYSFEKDNSNIMGNYETKKEAIESFLDKYNEKTKQSTSTSEIEDIKSKAKQAGNFMKAPNGKPSQLTEKQWLEVRTKSFKDWFGDWENNPKSASKVVDLNGEPLVVYHGTDQNFNTFNIEKGATPQFWFTNKKESIEKGEVGAAGSGYIMPVFLNITNPAGWEEEDSLVLDQILNEGFDGKIFEDQNETTYVTFEPNQIKSAEKNKGNYSSKNNNIYE